MSEQERKEKIANFVNKMHQQFNKHAVILTSADGRLEAEDYEGFEQTYATLPLNDLIEIVQAQHIKINELAHDRYTSHETTLNILRDISNCKDFLAFDDLKKKARSILLAQDMVERGANPEKVKEQLLNGAKGTATSNIIIQ